MQTFTRFCHPLHAQRLACAATRRAALIATLCAASPWAAAQSSVTIGGVVDLAARQTQVQGQASLKQLATSGIAGSRLMIRGSEDLGGGLEASFWLESDIAPDTGTSNATNFWSRRSTVSLSHRSYGELRLGRDYNALFLRQYVRFDAFVVNGVASAGSLVLSTPSLLGSGSLTGVRMDNVVKYVLPENLGGVYGEFLQSAGEGRHANKHSGGMLGYALGGLVATVGFGNTKDTAGTDTLKLTVLGASYDFEWARFMALVQTGRYKARKQDTLLLGMTVPVGQGRFKASAGRANQSGAGTDANDASQLSVGYQYSLSKRSTLYTTFSRIDNKGTQVFGLGGATPTAGKDVRGFDVGLSHAF